MVFVLKRPSEASPGIIIFTHKERRYFADSRALLSKAIDQLKARYVLGMHWGHFAEDVDPSPDIDFHLAGPGTLKLRAGSKTRVIPLCSRNFTPAVFQADCGEKYWDIILVARPLRLKKIDEFFLVLKSVITARPKTTALLVCPMIPEPNAKDVYLEIFADYLRIFSESERENITLLTPSEHLYPFPLSQGVMAYFFNRSRFFTLLSEQEGESRVIAEALLCGLPVFVRATLRGGGRDFLNSDNSCQFANLDEAAAMFLDALEQRRGFKIDSESLAQELRADYSGPQLREQIVTLFAELGHSFSGEMDLESLDRKLPSHCQILPERLRNRFTDDIRSESAFVDFSNMLTCGSAPALPISALAAMKLRQGLARAVDQALRGSIAVKRRFVPAWLWPTKHVR